MAKANPTKQAARAAGSPAFTQYSVAAGAGTNTNIAVSGINVEDQLLAVLDFQDTAGATQGLLANRVAEAAVTSAGNIQLTTTVTTGHGLLIIWLKVRK